MKKIVLPKFRDSYIGAPQLRLHHFCVEMAQASCEIPLRFGRIGFGKIQMQIWHSRLLSRIRWCQGWTISPSWRGSLGLRGDLQYDQIVGIGKLEERWRVTEPAPRQHVNELEEVLGRNTQSGDERLLDRARHS